MARCSTCVFVPGLQVQEVDDHAKGGEVVPTGQGMYGRTLTCLPVVVCSGVSGVSRSCSFLGCLYLGTKTPLGRVGRQVLLF